jgi:alcohol dehydrogenase, propanol-preferring
MRQEQAIMTTTTKTMRAMQITKPGAPLELVQRPIPEPGPRQLRIKVEACGVCHSDAMVQSGAFPGLSLPRIPGHEIAGRIDALGSAVHAESWKVGERVGVGWHGGHCFECTACRRGLFINCIKGLITGISHDGGYAEYMVAPQESVARIPDALAAVDAGPLLCAGITTYNALRNSGARPGDTVAIQGIGGLGHLAIQYAARMGFRTVALSRGEDKAELAHQLGAHVYLDTDKVGAAEGLQKLGGADLVLATASRRLDRQRGGRPQAARQADDRGRALRAIAGERVRAALRQDHTGLAERQRDRLRGHHGLQRAHQRAPAGRGLQARASGGGPR